MAESYGVTSARECRLPELLELTAGLRRALVQRGEHLPPHWPEEAAEDLKAGRLEGFVLGPPLDPRALAFLSLRPRRGFGQVHVASPDDRIPLAWLALSMLPTSAPVTVERIDSGVTGLTAAEERELGETLALRPGFEIVERFGLARPLGLDNPPEVPPLPAGYQFRSVRSFPLETVNALDWEAFRGGPDAAFIADSLESNRRLIEGIIGGQLGRFIDEASVAIADPSGRLVGFLLTVEESPRVGIFVDLAVDPAFRRHGLGRVLVQRGLRALLALGQASARLWVTESNRSARALYESVGFRREESANIYRWRRLGSVGPDGPSPHVER